MSARQHKSVSLPGPEKLDEVRNAVRSLWVIYNTGRTYRTGHEMFRKVVEESMPVFRSALEGIEDMPLFFARGEVRYGATSLEYGGGLFRKIAETFEAKGVSNLCFTPGLTTAELAGLTEVLTSRPEGASGVGLGNELTRMGVKHIKCRDIRIEVVDRESAKDSRATPKRKGMVARRGAPAGGLMAWNVDAETPVASAGGLGEVGAVKVAPAKSFKSFVAGALEAARRKEASDSQVAELISAEFDHELLKAVEQTRRESDKRVRKLETIQEVVLKQLEAMNLAAIVVDARLNVLAANESGRGILRGLSQIQRGSPLDLLIASRQEEQVVEIEGVKRRAHFIASSSVGGACLITLQ